MTSPIVEINSTSLGGWVSTTAGARAIAAGETVSVRLADSAGVGTWFLSVRGTDGTVATPTITQALLPNGTATFVAPASPSSGWSLLFQSQVGIYTLGKDANGLTNTGYTTGFKVYLPTSAGNQLLAVNETTEGDPQYGWTKSLNAALANPGSTSTINNTRVPWKGAARVVSTSNITLSGAQTIDGVSIVSGDRVLVVGQTLPANNGIYVCAVGTWARAADMASSADCIPGSKTSVSEGNLWSNTEWSLTTQGAITLGSTSLVFSPDRARTVAALRLCRGKVDGECAELIAYSTIGDGGGGEFYWDASNNNTTTPDNAGTVIVPTALIGGTGAWKRQYTGGAIDVKWFGAVGDWNGSTGTNDTSALDAASAALSAGGVLEVPAGNYHRTTAWTFAASATVRGVGRKLSKISFTGTGHVGFRANGPFTAVGLDINRPELAVDATDAAIRQDFSETTPVSKSFVRVSDCEISGFDIGIYTNGATNRDIDFVDVQNTNINTNALNANLSAIVPTITGNNIKKLIVKNCHLTSSLPTDRNANNIYSIGADVVDIDHNTLEGGIGVKLLTNIYGSCKIATVKGNHFLNCTQSILTMTDRNRFEILQIDGNTFDGSLVIDPVSADINISNLDAADDFTVNHLVSTTILTSSSGAHHRENGDVLYLGNIGGALPTGLPEGVTARTPVYVKNKTPTTFEVSLTSGGSAITFSADGSGENYWVAAPREYDYGRVVIENNTWLTSARGCVIYNTGRGHLIDSISEHGNRYNLFGTTSTGVYGAVSRSSLCLFKYMSCGKGNFINGGGVGAVYLGLTVPSGGSTDIGSYEEVNCTSATTGLPGIFAPLGVYGRKDKTLVFAESSTPGTYYDCLRTSGDTIYLGKNQAPVYIDAASIFRVLVDGSSRMQVTSGGTLMVYPLLTGTVTTHQNYATGADAVWRFAAQTADVPTSDYTWVANGPYPSATGVNRNSGGFEFQIPDPVSGGTSGTFRVKNASHVIFQVNADGVILKNAASVNVLETNATGIGFFGHAPAARPSAYTVTNPSTDRGLNVTGDTLAQGLAVLGTLIADLQSIGLLQ